MSDGFIDLSFGENDNDLSTKGRSFKAKEGESYRVSFAWWPTGEDGTPDFTAKSPQFIGVKRGFIDKVGKVVDKPELRPFYKQDPQIRAATIIVIWPTDDEGEIDAARLKKGKYQILTWDLPGSKYEEIKKIGLRHPYSERDLQVDCSDANFQKMTFMPLPESMFAKLATSGKPIGEELLSRVAKHAEGIKDDLAKDLSLAEVKQRLNGDQEAAAGPSAATEANTAAVDSALDDLLDD